MINQYGEKMKYNKSLLNQYISKLKGKKWYHQRFDGCPHFIHYIAEAEDRDEPRKQGWNFNVHVCFYNNDRADWFIPMEDINRVTNDILEKTKKDSTIGKLLIKDWEQSKKEFYDVCKKVHETKLSDLSDKELFALFNEFRKKTLDNVTSSSIIDCFALGSDEKIAKMISVLLAGKNLNNNYPEIFSKLTAPIDPSFINEAEVSLLRIALKIEEVNNGLKKFILTHTLEESLEEIKRDKQIYALLEKHEKEYFWSKNNYVHANILDKKHFMKELREIFETGFNIAAEIKKITETPSINKEVKKKLAEHLHVSPHLKNLLTISEEFTWWQDQRKKSSYLFTHYGSMLIEEIAKRKGLTLHEIKYITPSETMLLEKCEGKISAAYKNEIKEREKDCAMFWASKEHVCVTGKELEELKKTIIETEDYSKIQEFKGLCASPGYAKGRVKIIKSATEVDKIEKGDILVAIMTRPDYVAGMKKSAAIVTEEGGITCHAAIVSRELKIPCIIGTKIATKALKDGMMVEVDATNGVVRKI